MGNSNKCADRCLSAFVAANTSSQVEHFSNRSVRTSKHIRQLEKDVIEYYCLQMSLAEASLSVLTMYWLIRKIPRKTGQPIEVLCGGG